MHFTKDDGEGIWGWFRENRVDVTSRRKEKESVPRRLSRQNQKACLVEGGGQSWKKAPGRTSGKKNLKEI